MAETSLVSPEQAPTAPLRPKGRKRADLPFSDFIRGKLDRIDSLNELQEKRRIQTYVTLTRRYRGDLLGFFASDNSGTWIPCNNRGLNRVNVVAPVVRANNKNWMEAGVRLEISARNSDPEKAGAADLAQSIADLISKRAGNEHFEEMISELAQLSAAYFIYSALNSELGPTIKVPRVAKRPAQYFCPNCGSNGPADKALTGACPEENCSAPVSFVDSMQIPDGYDQQPGGDTETKLFTSYEMKVDERNCKGGELKDARFVRNNYLVFRNELEMLRPWALLDGAGEWTEGLKQVRALETSSAQSGDVSFAGGDNDQDEDLLDYRRYWLSKKSLAGYLSPCDYQHGDAKYGYSFEIKAGQSLDDVFAEEGFAGLYVERHGAEVLLFANQDFLKKWTVGHWQMDATTFWGKAQEDLLDLQEMRIEMVNIFFQAGMSMSLPPLIIDGRMFDGEDFVNDPGAIVYTRKGFEHEGGIEKYIQQMFPQSPGQEMFGFYNMLVQATDDSSGISPVSVGQGDRDNKTAHGQELLTQRAVGLIVPSQKSKAKAKIEWITQQLELVQKYYTPERYLPLDTKYGEEGKQADIEPFRNANVREDFVIGYIEGSEVPTTLNEKARNMGTVLASGLLENPNIPVELKQKVFRLAGIDYDIENFEAEIRLANARRRRIDKEITLHEQNGQAWVMDPQDGAPQLDPYNQPIPNPQAIMMLLNAPGCAIIPESDSHPAHAGFWSNQIKAEAAQDNADPFKLAVYRMRLKEHVSQINDSKPSANAQLMETMSYKDAPEDIRRQMEAQAGFTPSAGEPADGAEAASKAADHQAAAVEGDKQRAHEKIVKGHEIASKERQAEAAAAAKVPTGSPAVSAPSISG